MELPKLSELSKIIDLCRKKGVESIEIDNIKLVLSREAPQSRYRKKVMVSDNDLIPVENLYNEEDALFWSTTQPDEAQ